MTALFLDISEILSIHQDQIERYGGVQGVRDITLLESAINMASVTFEGQSLHGDLFEMAAAYLFHIVKNHPFTDGNKRAGAVAAYVFLELNGLELNADETEYERLVLSIASGDADKNAAADFFRKNTS